MTEVDTGDPLSLYILKLKKNHIQKKNQKQNKQIQIEMVNLYYSNFKVDIFIDLHYITCWMVTLEVG